MIVLVTGCRSGFGLRIARAAARAGHTVYAGLRDLDTKDALERETEGLDVRPVALDVTRADHREAAVARILAEEGRLDALVNNAGVALAGFLEQVTLDELRRLFEVNVFGLWALTKACLPTMRSQRNGLILNVSSMAARSPLPGVGAYAASKWAVEGMTEVLRHELRPFGVRVVLLEPGPYATDIFDRNRWTAEGARGGKGPYARYMRRVEQLVERTASRRGDPEDVAALAVKLLCEPRPALRYALGPGVVPRLAIRKLLPFRLQEQVVARVLGF
ncbi:MAG: SDR family NAD(P)-dependent oxidoreductase [Sandaracinaceae bacterium]